MQNDYNIPQPIEPMTFPLLHPPTELDVKADKKYFSKCLRPQMFPTLIERAVGKSRIMLSKVVP